MVSFGAAFPTYHQTQRLSLIVYKGPATQKALLSERLVKLASRFPARNGSATMPPSLICPFREYRSSFYNGETEYPRVSFTELAQQILFPTFKSSDINGLMLGGGGSFLNLWHGHSSRRLWKTSIDPPSVRPSFRSDVSPWFLEWPFSWELIITGVNSTTPSRPLSNAHLHSSSTLSSDR